LISAATADDRTGLDYFLPVDQANYDPAVPSPEQAAASPIGQWHLHHHEVVDYLRQVAASSERVELAEYARSHGRRPLVYLTITSPENHTRLSEIRKAHVARAVNAQKGAKSDELANAPIVVWMGYGIHGNEPSATHAGVLLAYHLAAARDPQTVELLRKAVVLIDPCLNPDGFERFSDWTNNYRGQFPSSHRSDREHQEAWPGGRFNYYWFDLNRDWLAAVHPESRGRLRLFHQWQPNIVTDYHEMGNVNRTYFFQPGIAKMVNPLTPAANQLLTAKMAHEHARALDALGSLYYTGESFDDFYIGKGSTYPDVNGSVGVLFEQASSRGFHQDTEHGRLRFSFTIRNQVATSLSTLRTAAALRHDFLGYQQQFFEDALAEAETAATHAHIFAAPGDKARLAEFQSILELHQIDCWPPAEKVEVDGQTFLPEESLVVPTRQRQYRLLTALFEARTEFASNNFYDVSAWRLPSAFGLLHAELKQEAPPASKAKIARQGAWTSPEKPYAYAFAWEPRFAPRALFRLLEAKARCWVATRPLTFETEGKKVTYPHGSIVVPVGVQDELNSKALRRLMRTIAKQDQLEVCSLSTGYQGAVPTPGSPTLQPVKPTGVLLVVGTGVTASSAGEIWHQMDQIWRTSLAKLDADRITSTALKDFSTVILTGTSFSNLPSSAREALQRWVAGGGCLIAIGTSAGSLADQEWCKVDKVKVESADASGKEPMAKAATKVPDEPMKPIQHSAPYDQADERRTAKSIDGAIVRAWFDPTHPLAYGLGPRKEVHLMRASTTFLKPAANHYLTPIRYTDEPLVAGFISAANQQAMKGSAAVQIKVVGSGRVVLMIDDPVFRGHWLGSEKLLANAIFFGPLVSADGGEDDDAEHE
jgi:hypothetical protein